MRILIYGAGVIGSIFANKLAHSGNSITVFACGKSFEELKNNGIVLANPKTQKVEQITVNVINALLPNDQYDYIIVAMQRTQVDEFFLFYHRIALRISCLLLIQRVDTPNGQLPLAKIDL